MDPHDPTALSLVRAFVGVTYAFCVVASTVTVTATAIVVVAAPSDLVVFDTLDPNFVVL